MVVCCTHHDNFYDKQVAAEQFRIDYGRIELIAACISPLCFLFAISRNSHIHIHPYEDPPPANPPLRPASLAASLPFSKEPLEAFPP